MIYEKEEPAYSHIKTKQEVDETIDASVKSLLFSSKDKEYFRPWENIIGARCLVEQIVKLSKKKPEEISLNDEKFQDFLETAFGYACNVFEEMLERNNELGLTCDSFIRDVQYLEKDIGFFYDLKNDSSEKQIMLQEYQDIGKRYKIISIKSTSAALPLVEKIRDEFLQQAEELAELGYEDYIEPLKEFESVCIREYFTLLDGASKALNKTPSNVRQYVAEQIKRIDSIYDENKSEEEDFLGGPLCAPESDEDLVSTDTSNKLIVIVAQESAAKREGKIKDLVDVNTPVLGF